MRHSAETCRESKIGVQIAKEYADDEDAFSKKIYDVIGAGVGIIESVPAAVSIAYYTQDPNNVV